MVTLQELYSAIRTLNEYAKPVHKELLDDVDKLEEEYISETILPALNDTIEPLLSEIQRGFTLIVDYDPQKHLSVRISRESNVSQTIKNAETLQDEGFTPRIHHTRGKYTGLCVTLIDGTVINEAKAMDTYVKAIVAAGVERVLSLEMEFGGLPFLYERLNPKYAECQQPMVNDRYHVNTCFDNLRKKRYLDIISDALGLGWKVDIIK